MVNVNEILDRAGVPRENQLVLIRDLWDAIRKQDPSLNSNFNLVICPNKNGELEVDILPKPALNPLPTLRLPEKPWKTK